MNSLQLFLNQIQSAPEKLKTSVLQVLFDILMVHEEELLGSQVVSEQVVAFLLHVLEIEDSPAVQAALCIGIAKLMLAGLIDDERVHLCFSCNAMKSEADAQGSGVDQLSAHIRVAGNRRQPRSAAMPCILPPCLLLLVPREPDSDAEDWDHVVEHGP